MNHIKRYFESYKKAAGYSDVDIEKIMSDENMIRNKNKITSIIKNAKEFIQLAEKYGSYRSYLLSFGDAYPLKDDLQRRFHYIGPATVNHLLTDYGFPVLKPDRMVMRVLAG